MTDDITPVMRGIALALPVGALIWALLLWAVMQAVGK